MKDLDRVFAALAHSAFRRRFRLAKAETEYLAAKGLPTVAAHARELIAKRLAPADPPNDGRQTPFRGHPVFVAQHATATCCRSCLQKWHGIEKGKALSKHEQAHAVAAIERWLVMQMQAGAFSQVEKPHPQTGSLF